MVEKLKIKVYVKKSQPLPKPRVHNERKTESPTGSAGSLRSRVGTGAINNLQGEAGSWRSQSKLLFNNMNESNHVQ